MFVTLLFQCIVREMDLNYIESATQCISTQCKILEYTKTLSYIDVLTSQIDFDKMC